MPIPIQNNENINQNIYLFPDNHLSIVHDGSHNCSAQQDKTKKIHLDTWVKRCDYLGGFSSYSGVLSFLMTSFWMCFFFQKDFINLYFTIHVLFGQATMLVQCSLFFLFHENNIKQILRRKGLKISYLMFNFDKKK